MSRYGDSIAAEIRADSAMIPVSVTALLKECRGTADMIWAAISELEERLEPLRVPRPIGAVGEDVPTRQSRSPLANDATQHLDRLREIQSRIAMLGEQLEL